MKLFILTIAILILHLQLFLLLSFSIASAQTIDKETKVASSSFEIFWPLSAGQVRGDKLYFLKRWKEGVRGLFIFSSGPKADYQTILGSKRLLEAEKLLQNNNEELADKTIDDAIKELTSAKNNWDKSKQEGNVSETTRIELKYKIKNVLIFTPILKEKYPQVLLLDKLNDTAKEFLSAL